MVVIKIQVQGLCKISNDHWLPCGNSLRSKLWWRYMPGVIVNVRWPNGPVVNSFEEQYDSADPNDHYRPFLEKYVGRQGWDWDWGMGNRDATDNRLTIKLRRRHEKYATIIAMRWS